MIHVMYVDDEPDLLDLGKIFLEQTEGIKVTTCLSARKALGMLGESSFDAIISDYMMPDMDGIRFLKEVRGHHNDLPFILFSGKGREEVVIEAINNGADSYVQKGGNITAQFAELSHRLRQVVDRRNAEHALHNMAEEVKHIYGLSLDMLAIADLEGRIIRANGDWRSSLGYGKEDIEGRSSIELVHPEDLEKTKVAWDRLRSGQPIRDFINRVRAKGGEYRWIEWRFIPYQGRFVYSAARDVTESIRSEEKIREANEALRRQIEEITQAQKELADSEQNFRSLVENAPEAIYLATDQFRFAYVNPAAVRLLGARSEKELLGTLTLDRIHPSLHALIRERVHDLRVENRAVETIEEVYVRMDGEPIFVEVNAVPLTGRGEVTMMIILRDISSRKRAKEDLARSQSMLKAVLNNFPGVVYWKDLDLRYLGANRESARIAGLSDPSEFVGKSDYDMPWAGTHAEAYRADDRLVIESGRPRMHVIESQARAGGEIGWLDTSKVPLRDSEDRIIGVLGTSTDITERVLAEQRLKEAEGRNRRLLEQSFDAVIKHRGGKITMANDAAATLVKATGPEEIIGRPLSEFLVAGADEAIRQRIQGLYDNPGILVPVLEERFRCLDGSIIDTEVMATSFTEEGEPTVQVVFRDITKRKRMEEELKRSEENVRAINTKLALLNSITRHDILNKVSALQLNIELARGRFRDREVMETLDRLSKGVQEIHAHIEFSRIYQDLGVQEPRWQSVESSVSSLVVPHELTLVSDTAGWEIFADPMLEKVFYNLLDNSLRHGERCTRVDVSFTESEDGLTLIWKDNGVGISSLEKDKIFERGYGRNTGLGLFISREILAITKLSIRENGQEGEGARFEIHVPKGAYRRAER